MQKSFFLFYLLLAIISSATAGEIRVKKSFDFDWKFIISDSTTFSSPAFSDSKWSDVQLPHDWNIGMKFERSAGGAAAYLPGTVGWYRKTFDTLRDWKGKRISILFDGIFHQSDVYINGHHLGFRPYGFGNIEYDLTPYLNSNGRNVLAVRVNCMGERPRWYTGSGIYRHAWLQIVNPIHVVTNGTYVTTPVVDTRSAEVKVVSTVRNETSQASKISVTQYVCDDKGKVVAKATSASIVLPGDSVGNVSQSLTVSSPHLWDIDNPCLYTLKTEVKENGKLSDNYATAFGIRTIKFDNNKGFFLNGRHVKLQGMCLHQDDGVLGVAVPDRGYERRLQILKEFGCNAIRCSHNQPAPEFLNMCDRMGFLVLDEAFDKWKSGYYKQYFDKWWQHDLSNMLLRDRNHPSIILWSIGNELQEAWEGSDEGVDRARMLQDFVHKTEPTRLVMLAAQNGHQAKFSGVTDIVGYNYLEARMLSDHEKYPERRFLISEELPYYSGAEGNIRSYGTNNPWNTISSHDFIAGGFIWSGVDYLGESGWPSKGWPNGLFDICMTEKPRAAFLRAMWNKKPMVSIAVMDHALDIDHGRDLWQWPPMASMWNFPDSYKGIVMDIRTTTNCESVELYFNGKLLGKNRTVDFPNHAIEWHLPYWAGTLVAKGFDGNTQVAEDSIKTAGSPDHLVLAPDRKDIKADGQDLSYITVELKDKDGNLVQAENRDLTVSVEGAGRFRGIMSGDLRRPDSFTGDTVKSYFGKALILVQADRIPGHITVHVKMQGSDKEYTTIITTYPLS